MILQFFFQWFEKHQALAGCCVCKKYIADALLEAVEIINRTVKHVCKGRQQTTAGCLPLYGTTYRTSALHVATLAVAHQWNRECTLEGRRMGAESITASVRHQAARQRPPHTQKDRQRHLRPAPGRLYQGRDNRRDTVPPQRAAWSLRRVSTWRGRDDTRPAATVPPGPPRTMATGERPPRTPKK